MTFVAAHGEALISSRTDILYEFSYHFSLGWLGFRLIVLVSFRIITSPSLESLSAVLYTLAIECCTTNSSLGGAKDIEGQSIHSPYLYFSICLTSMKVRLPECDCYLHHFHVKLNISK